MRGNMCGKWHRERQVCGWRWDFHIGKVSVLLSFGHGKVDLFEDQVKGHMRKHSEILVELMEIKEIQDMSRKV